MGEVFDSKASVGEVVIIVLIILFIVALLRGCAEDNECDCRLNPDGFVIGVRKNGSRCDSECYYDVNPNW